MVSFVVDPFYIALCSAFLYTPYNHAACYFMQSHIRKVHAYLAVTCHLHFWQNDRGLLRDTAVTQGWNGGGTDTEKKILPPLCRALPCRDRSVMALCSPQKDSPGETIHSTRQKYLL